MLFQKGAFCGFPPKDVIKNRTQTTDTVDSGLVGKPKSFMSVTLKEQTEDMTLITSDEVPDTALQHSENTNTHLRICSFLFLS